MDLRTTLTKNLQGHALDDVAHGSTVPTQISGSPAEHIDETRGDGQTCGIHIISSRPPGQVSYGLDRVRSQGYVSFEGSFSTAVVNQATRMMVSASGGWQAVKTRSSARAGISERIDVAGE